MKDHLNAPLQGSFLAALLLAPSAAVAQSATIEGTITDADDGAAVAGATVAVSNPASGQTLPIETTTTDTAGDYTLDIPLDTGTTLEVVVEAAGEAHAPARHAWSDPLPCYFNCGPGGEILIEEGMTHSGIDIALENGGTISGTVTAADTGAPLEGASVRPVAAVSHEEFSFHFRASTDGGGGYTSPLALLEGDYLLFAHPPSGDNYVVQAWDGIECEHQRGCPIFETDSIVVNAGADAAGHDFSLAPGARIEGSVLPDDIERTIALYHGSGHGHLTARFLHGTSLPESEWSFEGLSGGSYYISLGPFTGTANHLRILHNGLLCPFSGCERARGMPVSVPAGGSLSIPAIDLPTGGQIDGVVVDADSGTSPPGLPTNGSFGSYNIIDGDGDVVGGGVITMDGGELTLSRSAAVPPGDYYVRTYGNWSSGALAASHSSSDLPVPGYADAVYPDVACAGSDCDLGAATAVTVTDGGVSSITLEIEEGSEIRGTVVDAVSGDPFGNDEAVVKLVDADNETLAATRTDEDGAFTLGAFPAGSYYVRTSMAGRYGQGHFGVQNAFFDRVHGASVNCSELLCAPTDGSAVSVDGSSDVDLPSLEVEPGPVISGRIIDQWTDLPLLKGFVAVRTDSGSLVGRYRIDPRTARYQTTALPPGDYTLEPEVSEAYSDVSTSGGPTPSSRSVSAGSGTVVTVEDESVEADLAVVDNGIDRLFNDRFELQ